MSSRARRTHSPLPRTVAVALMLLAGIVQAATYKWVDGQGRVTYGDRPPHADMKTFSAGVPPAASPAPGATGDPRLPYAVRSAVARFPVTLYTAKDCQVCDSARAHLARRGVPYAERVLRTQADLEAFKRIGFAEPTIPALGVGNERMAGFDGAGWDRLLDAAGYPRTSALPNGWRPNVQPLSGGKPLQVDATPAKGSATPAERPATTETASSAATASPTEPALAPERDYGVPAQVTRGAPPPSLRPSATPTPTNMRF